MSNRDSQLAASAFSALQKIGNDPAWRSATVRALRDLENQLARSGVSVRDELTGPLMDALFANSEVLEKELSNGVKFEFLYRMKIARDFLLSTPEVPDHVWEPQTTRLLVELAREAQNVLIGGAYFGDQAIIVAKTLADHSGRLLAFEPNPEQAAMLKRNVALNALENVTIEGFALWDADDAQLCFDGEDSHASMRSATDPHAPAPTQQVFQTVTIDRYLQTHGIAGVDLIMIDIEGSELRALRGAAGQLARPASEAPDLVFEIHSSFMDWSQGLHRTEIVEFLAANGYQVFALRDFQSNYDLAGQPIELIAPEDTYLEGPKHGFNMLATKDPDLIKRPLFRLVKGVSPKLLAHKDPTLHHPVGGL